MYKLCIDKDKKFVNHEEFTRPTKFRYFEFLEENCEFLETRFTDHLCGKEPIRVCVSFRTDYTNKMVVEVDNDSCEYSFYIWDDVVPTCPCNLNEAVLMIAKSSLDLWFDFDGFDEHKFISNTALQITGAYKVDGRIFVYVNVIMSHKLEEGVDFKFRPAPFSEVKFKPISELRPTDKVLNGLEETLLKECIIVKESV